MAGWWGPCAEKGEPLSRSSPAHWAPNDMVLYDGQTVFRLPIGGGVFIAFHGSWNRAPVCRKAATMSCSSRSRTASLPGPYVVFADGFAGGRQRTRSGRANRPLRAGAGAPDGARSNISDDQAWADFGASLIGGPSTAAQSRAAPAPVHGQPALRVPPVEAARGHPPRCRWRGRLACRRPPAANLG